MKVVLATLVFLASLAAAAYVGIVVCLVGGIETIVSGASAHPVNAGEIAWGVVRVVPLAELSSGVIIIIGVVLAGLIGGSNSVFGRRSARFSRSRRSFL